MFRPSTIIRDLALNLAKVIMLKHSVKLGRYLLFGCVAASHGMASVLHAVQNATYSAQHATQTPFHDMLPHNRIVNNNVISPSVLT